MARELTEHEMGRHPGPVEADAARLPPTGDVMVHVGVLSAVDKLDGSPVTNGVVAGVSLLHGIQEGVADHREIPVPEVSAGRGVGLG